ncbi:flagellin-like protein [Scopulibacillus darangshiensis]|uniref:Anti-sigma-W factor RsiW n=1 Tax=Scopulibacillus darangshiensis TaxID=442528 RepID=A0A4R2NI95_9BACL|nr:anti-sigma factor [Scopulibacillus darangshiensis]TCP21070.1 flagellin-like protein [Scopulibacillus darangshiensis]
MANECEHLMDYLAGELTEKEAEHFQRHLSRCEQCSSELEQLQEAWHSLPSEAEHADVPPELKSEVMNFVFNEASAESPRTMDASEKITAWTHRFIKGFAPITATIIVLLFIVSAGLLYENIQLRSTATERITNAAKTTQLFLLQSIVQTSHAKGYAAVIKTGDDRELIVNLKDLPILKGKEAYQVWLLKDGKRQNAGTLRPAKDGHGMLTYRLPGEYKFDAIGITLEPNAHGTKPRGKKVIGMAQG